MWVHRILVVGYSIVLRMLTRRLDVLKAYTALSYSSLCTMILVGCLSSCSGSSSYSTQGAVDSVAVDSVAVDLIESSLPIHYEEYNEEVQVVEYKTDKEIPNEVSVGEVIQYQGKNKVERNMLSQFSSYNSALLSADVDNAAHYQYPDAAKYFRRFYPGKSDKEITKAFFQEVSGMLREAARKFAEHGTSMNIVASKLHRKVEQGDAIIYVFDTVINYGNKKLKLHSTPELTVAISLNGGKNWTFNTMNDENVPNMLRLRFSDEVVDRVMGY